MHYCDNSKHNDKCVNANSCHCECEKKEIQKDHDHEEKDVKDDKPGGDGANEKARDTNKENQKRICKPKEKVERKDHHIKKKKIALDVPTYENELSMFTKNIKEILEKFKKERLEWGNPLAETNATDESLEEEVSPETYHGRYVFSRFLLLKKLGFKTNRLRSHHKSLRPLKYYTLKRRVFDVPVAKEGEENSREVDTSAVREKASRKKKDKKKGAEAAEIIEKLRATKRGRKLLESCKCETGKEVTFIIKGVCLCEKKKTRNFEMTKTCGEFCKSQIDDTIREVRPSDSLEIYRKKSETLEKENSSKKKTELHFESWDDFFPEETKTKKKSSKAVSFKEVNDSENESAPVAEDKAKDEKVQDVAKNLAEKKREEEKKEMKPEKDMEAKVQKENEKTAGKTIDEKEVAKEKSSVIILYKNQNVPTESDFGLTEDQKRILDAYNRKING